MAKRIRSWAPACLWMAITFVVSHQPVVVIPFGAPDYLAHAVNYGVLAALYVWAIAGGDGAKMLPKLIVPAVLLAILYGISDEFHQSFIPGRDVSIRDVIADAAGGTVGALAAAALGAVWRGRKLRMKD